MTKNDSLILKGVAILMMLWHHLFCYYGYYTAMGITVKGMPIEQLLAIGFNPVPFFAFLSGYGLYKSYAQRQRSVSAASAQRQRSVSAASAVSFQSFMGNIKRALRLYIHYWITLAIFLPIAGYMLGFDKYPQSLSLLVQNITGYNTTYNTETWFLLPYILLMVLSGLFYKFVSKCHWVTVLVVAMALHVVQLNACNLFILITRQYHPMFLTFILGMLTAKTVNFEKIREILKGKTMLTYALLLEICLFYYMDPSIWVRSFFATAFCILLASLPHTAVVDRVLIALGNRATSMWFIHSWFCYTLCHAFIYSFKYAIPIFIVLVLISYVCSIPIDYVHSKILRLVGLSKK